ncbi:hypothetical protein J5J86_19595 [Aquabacter sp. L1I39]|uniref:hypothetical protein n=1 Tax=Aquabacter sp. L1I39 TaxID=2820278 RepID=UPI001ADBCAD2|nr:hypothetical protein [Aquabacter sp. L1I39]QTL02949.1 hypothetical protein J5J86_19595 [Aquabacter sp. L1I39]
MEHMAGLVFAALVSVLLALFALAFVLHVRGKLAVAARSRIVWEGKSARVPLVAAFSGWKGVPWLGFSSSNLKPTLVLHPDHVECRVIRTRRKPYAAVSRVDYRATLGTRNVVLEFRDCLTSFAGNTANADVARAAIRLLGEKGCPLSERACRLLDG